MILRRKPIQRTPLAAPTIEQVRAWESRPRKPIGRNATIKPLGARGRRLEAAWRRCKAIVMARSRGYCEGNVRDVCPQWRHGASDVHHVWPEDRAAGVHDPARCLHLCRVVHNWADDEPGLARVAGITRPLSGIPGRASRHPSTGIV